MAMLHRCWAALILGGAAIAGCSDGYGYSGVSVGYGSPGFYDSAYGYDGLDYASVGGGYYGWYGDYYYPGTGYYVYDRARRPYRWNDGQRAYWETRRQAWRGDRRPVRGNWQGFAASGQRPSGFGNRVEGRRGLRGADVAGQPEQRVFSRREDRPAAPALRDSGQPRSWGRGAGRRR